jgi:glycosyltransferase involved in cell wall biosynthesis
VAEVVFLTRILTHYRVPFHEGVRARLSSAGITYRLVYGTPTSEEMKKGDLATLEWAELTPTAYFLHDRLVWQSLPVGQRPDLVIVGQENKNLINYWLQVTRYFTGVKVALFGHGRNFQARNSASLGERFKRFWITRADWWFAYTERSAEIVAECGFSRDRITIFNNSIDTSAIRRQLATISAEERDTLRRESFSGSENIAVYIGGLYDLKRIDFMIEAAELVRESVPDFQLLVIGKGPDFPIVQKAADRHAWLHAQGACFGREKTLLASLGSVLLMPGLVGLGVLDSFAYGIPMVTTAVPYHSPEVDYLQDGVNGVVVQDCDDVSAYAKAVVEIFQNQTLRNSLKIGASEALENYSIEKMAERFSDGVISALAL